jgi:transcriptional regulator with XRE-family HTH domain
MTNNDNPLLSIRKKLNLSLKDFGLLTGVYFLRILEIEKGHLESIPFQLLDSLLSLKLIDSKEEFLTSYEMFISIKLRDLKERALNNV